MGSEAPHRLLPDATPLLNQAAVSVVAGSTSSDHAAIQLVDRGGIIMCLRFFIPQPITNLNPLLSPSRTGLLPPVPHQPDTGTFLWHICPHLDDEVCERLRQCLEDVGGLPPWLQASSTQGQFTQPL